MGMKELTDHVLNPIDYGDYFHGGPAQRRELVERITAAINAAVAEEREACAKVAEEFDRPHHVFESRGGPRPPIQQDIAAAIRARGQ